MKSLHHKNPRLVWTLCFLGLASTLCGCAEDDASAESLSPTAVIGHWVLDHQSVIEAAIAQQRETLETTMEGPALDDELAALEARMREELDPVRTEFYFAPDFSMARRVAHPGGEEMSAGTWGLSGRDIQLTRTSIGEKALESPEVIYGEVDGGRIRLLDSGQSLILIRQETRSETASGR